MRLCLALAFGASLLQAKPPVKRPEPELLKIDNETVQVGINKAMGASITHLSWTSLGQKNIVNSYDPARLIQQSYYAGSRIDRKKEGQHKAWSPWNWNPIQGGGVGSWAKVTHFEKRGSGNQLDSETIPKLWDMPNEEAAAVMKQQTSFEPGCKNAIAVQQQIICHREPGHRWGPAKPSHQEVPALYFTRNFDSFKAYLGDGKWRLEQQATGPPRGTTNSPKQAMACFEANGQGIAIFSPSAVLWNFGPSGPGNTTDPSAAPCTHIAPVAVVELGPQSTLTYSYWLVTGTEQEIATTLDILCKKHAKEKFTLTNPK